MDHFVQEEMFRLRTNAQYKLVMVYLKSYRSKILIVESLKYLLFNITF